VGPKPIQGFGLPDLAENVPDLLLVRIGELGRHTPVMPGKVENRQENGAVDPGGAAGQRDGHRVLPVKRSSHGIDFHAQEGRESVLEQLHLTLVEDPDEK
jgi:hypothetical protein